MLRLNVIFMVRKIGQLLLSGGGGGGGGGVVVAGEGAVFQFEFPS